MKLIRDGGGGGEKGRLYTYPRLHCHHQNDSCIKMGSDETHVNVSLIVRDKVTRRCPQTTTSVLKRKESQLRSGIEPKSLSVFTSLTPYH